MPTTAYADGYRDGFKNGFVTGFEAHQKRGGKLSLGDFTELYDRPRSSKPKRKLSAWNKFVKANAKKPRFRLRSGSPNLKKLGVAFRKTPAGKKKRR